MFSTLDAAISGTAKPAVNFGASHGLQEPATADSPETMIDKSPR